MFRGGANSANLRTGFGHTDTAERIDADGGEDVDTRTHRHNDPDRYLNADSHRYSNTDTKCIGCCANPHGGGDSHPNLYINPNAYTHRGWRW